MTGERQIVCVARDSYAGAFTDGRFFAGVVRQGQLLLMIIDNGYAVADAGATFDSASPTGKRMLKSYPDAFEAVAPDAHLKAIPAPGRILPARPR